MTHLSRRILQSKTEKELKSILKEALLNLKFSEDDKVFYSLITKTEELMIAKRLGVILMLSEGATYEEISESLKLTNETISRVHFEMNSHPATYKFLLNKLKPWKRRKLLKEILGDLGFRALKLTAKHVGGRIY